MKQEKSLLEQKYDIDNECGRALVKDFEKEIAPFINKKKTVLQKYEGGEVKNELIGDDIYLLEIGAIVFRDGDCGFRVVPEIFTEAKTKIKQLRKLEARREWTKNNF